MKKGQRRTPESAKLRRQAEARLRRNPIPTDRSRAQAETPRLVHELRVRQIELELQNEELARARAQIKRNPTQYADPLVAVTDIIEREQAERALRENKARVRVELDNLSSLEGDIGALELVDIIDVSAMQAMLDDFFKLTRIGMALIDLRGRVLVKTGWQEICLKFHRVDLRTQQNCIESDTLLSRGVEPRTFKLYRCKNQMYDIATPIVVGGRHLGNLFLGQFFFEDEPPDRESFRAQARHYGFDEEKYLAALDRTPRWSRDKVNTAMAFYTKLAHLCSTLSYSNIQLVHNVMERQRAQEALQASAAQYRAVIETSPDGFWILDIQGHLLEVNDAYTHLSGYSHDELRRMTIADLEASETPVDIAARIERIIQEGNALFQTLHRAKSGRVWQAEVNVTYWPIEGGRFFAFIRDINRRQRSDALLKVRLRLSEIAATGSLDDVLQAALDAAERFTGSRIGFFHFVEPDQETLTLQTWSTNTVNFLCKAEGKDLHYPISEAGVWADCIRQRRPIVHNDYASLPDRKDLPEGHVVVIRELTVPILRNDQVVAIIGIGNKPEDYTDDDVDTVQQLALLMIDAVERKRAEARIERLAYYDALTQLPNRVLLTDRLQQAMAQTQRDQRRLAVCYLDLDEFKPINDTWGHAHGDRVLVEVTHRLKSCVRAGDTVARLGGDEFAVLLGDLADLEECEHALDRVMTALQVPFMVSGHSMPLTVSIGVTLYPDDRSDPDTLLRHADQTMYAAKQAGGDRYQLFDADYDRRARNYRECLQQIRDGLETGEFRLHYQPKVDMRQGRVIGVEALIRWQHPVEGLLAPARFMPAVETSDLAIVVGQWVLNEALRQMSAWAARDLWLPVSVNLSIRHLQQPDFVSQLQTLLMAYPEVRPDWLELEILETAALDDIMATSALIEGCRRLGVRFALDDFGTGYSSLTYLKHLPVHLLKIDQSFVRDMLMDAEAMAIVQGIIGLSKVFHRQVIAEGVETNDHGSLLLRLGCDLAQGYGIARAMPPEQIPTWLAGWSPPNAWLGLADAVRDGAGNLAG